MWEYLGVAGDSGATPAITDDQNKLNSNFLRGTIAQGLADTSTGILHLPAFLLMVILSLKEHLPS